VRAIFYFFFRLARFAAAFADSCLTRSFTSSPFESSRSTGHLAQDLLDRPYPTLNRYSGDAEVLDVRCEQRPVVSGRLRFGEAYLAKIVA